MSTYCYDGSFEGFLCAVAWCAEHSVSHPEFTSESIVPGLFSVEAHEVVTDRETAVAFRKRFVESCSRDAFATARYAFQSRQAGIENLLWRYLKLGLETGPTLTAMLADERVSSVDRVARTVAREAHKFKGFVRFREVEPGFLYASIEPDFDILPLIAPHFTTRVGDRSWMIHDLRRSRAAVYDLQRWVMVDRVELTGAPELSESEERFTALWQRYFRSMAIESRRNPKLQQQHVPLKYRRHLLEFDEKPPEEQP